MASHSSLSSEASAKEETFTRKKPFSPMGESGIGLAAGRSIQGTSSNASGYRAWPVHFLIVARSNSQMMSGLFGDAGNLLSS